jgi:hypothetical protein
MAMGWLKGLVAPAAFGNAQGAPQGMPGMQPFAQPQGGPPIGGAPSPYGVAQGPGGQANMPPPGTPPIGAPGGPAPYDASQLPGAMQWSTGTRTQGGGISGVGAASASAAAAGGSLEARCAQLQHDVESLALFARTLLTMLEEAKVVTREQFDATKQRLDMLDGKLDDR